MLSLQDPVCTPEGFLFSKEAIIENLIQQKKAIKRKHAAWEAQQADDHQKAYPPAVSTACSGHRSCCCICCMLQLLLQLLLREHAHLLSSHVSPHGHHVCARLSTVPASVASIASSELADPLCTGMLSIPINACLVCYCLAGGRA